MGGLEGAGEQFLPVGQRGGKYFGGEGTQKASPREGKGSILSFSSLRNKDTAGHIYLFKGNEMLL